MHNFKEGERMSEQGIIERSEDKAAADTDSSEVVERLRRRVKAPRQEFERQILALLDKHGEMSIGDIHRALLKEVDVSYGLVQQIVGRLVQEGRLGRLESWPRRYYRQAAQDAATATQSTSPREMVAAALGRGRGPRPEMGRHGQEDDLGELEAEVLAVARELGPCTLSELHAALLQHHKVPYPLMLGAVRKLVSRRYLQRRQREDSRYIYQALGDEQS
jgi:predicted transcriptional regulator